MRIGQGRGLGNQIMRRRLLIRAGRTDEDELPRAPAKELKITLNIIRRIGHPIHHGVVGNSRKGLVRGPNVMNIKGQCFHAGWQGDFMLSAVYQSKVDATLRRQLCTGCADESRSADKEYLHADFVAGSGCVWPVCWD